MECRRVAAAFVFPPSLASGREGCGDGKTKAQAELPKDGLGSPSHGSKR